MRCAVAVLVLLVATAGAAAAAPPPPAPAKSPPAAKARRLEDIRIEGDVPVPQVLFITARDPRRFLDFRHAPYRMSSLELARTAVLPTRVAVIGTVPIVQHKESAK